MSERAQRQLSAILAADVAGYSRLVGIDEEGTLARLKALRRTLIDPKIEEHRGRIVKTMGDGLLVQFASVVDAVRCAVDMQRQLAEENAGTGEDRRIVFRMGINVGDVVIDGDDIYGDGVNVAARLETLAEPGGICVSGSVHDQVRDKLDLSFEDMGEQQLKNIARAVRVYRAHTAPIGKSASFALPNKPSIAVLPFQNISGDPEQDYFADGIVEDIITALARIRWLFVIARNSSFTYKGRAVDIKQVGRELGVRYVLEGSVRKAGNRLRITGQLIDVSTGAHLWADRFDGELQDIFDLQDQVTSSVVGAISPRLEQAEIERATHKPTESLDAYDYYLRGMAAFHRFNKQSNEEAIGLFYKAIELDSQFASAFGMAARCYAQRKGFGWVADAVQETAEAARLARRAIELGGNDAVALGAAGFALLFVVGDVNDGAALIERSLTLNPNLAWLWHFSALAKVCLGESRTAIEHALRAIRLSPHDPQMFVLQIAAAFGYFVGERYGEALTSAEAALRERPNFLVGNCIAAASAALSENTAEAAKYIQRVRSLEPSLRLSNLQSLIPFKRKEDFGRWAEGLRLAGLPD